MIVVQEYHDPKTWYKLLKTGNFLDQASFDINKFKDNGKQYPHFHISARFKKPISFTHFSKYYFKPKVSKENRIKPSKTTKNIRTQVARKNCAFKQVTLHIFNI